MTIEHDQSTARQYAEGVSPLTQVREYPMTERAPGLMNCRWTIRRNEHGEPRVVADPNPTEEGRNMGAEWVVADKIVSFRDPEEQEEYARLIAAAPDLLEALKSCVKELAQLNHECAAGREATHALSKAWGIGND